MGNLLPILNHKVGILDSSSPTLPTLVTPDPSNGQMVDLDEFAAAPKRGVPHVKPFIGMGGHWYTTLPRIGGSWEGDKWVTNEHEYTKVNGEWRDETGAYVATATANENRTRKIPTKEERDRRRLMVQQIREDPLFEAKGEYARQWYAARRQG